AVRHRGHRACIRRGSDARRDGAPGGRRVRNRVRRLRRRGRAPGVLRPYRHRRRRARVVV
ncbi:hypothetical protein HK405_005258, partial [Cladochytrium tenue]